MPIAGDLLSEAACKVGFETRVIAGKVIQLFAVQSGHTVLVLDLPQLVQSVEALAEAA